MFTDPATSYAVGEMKVDGGTVGGVPHQDPPFHDPANPDTPPDESACDNHEAQGDSGRDRRSTPSVARPSQRRSAQRNEDDRAPLRQNDALAKAIQRFWRRAGFEQIQDELRAEIRKLNAGGSVSAYAQNPVAFRNRIAVLIEKHQLEEIAEKVGFGRKRTSPDRTGATTPEQQWQAKIDDVKQFLTDDLQMLDDLERALEESGFKPKVDRQIRKSKTVFNWLFWPTMIWIFLVPEVAQNYRNGRYISEAAPEFMLEFHNLFANEYMIGFFPLTLLVPRIWCYWLEIGFRYDEEWKYLGYCTIFYAIEIGATVAILQIKITDSIFAISGVDSISRIIACYMFSSILQLETGALCFWREELLNDGLRPKLLTHLSVLLFWLANLFFLGLLYWDGFLYAWIEDRPPKVFWAMFIAMVLYASFTSYAAHHFVLIEKLK